MDLPVGGFTHELDKGVGSSRSCVPYSLWDSVGSCCLNDLFNAELEMSMTTLALVTSVQYTVECCQCGHQQHGELEGDILNDGDPKLHLLVDENLQLFGWKLLYDKDGATLFNYIFCSNECLQQHFIEEEEEND